VNIVPNVTLRRVHTIRRGVIVKFSLGQLGFKREFALRNLRLLYRSPVLIHGVKLVFSSVSSAIAVP